MESTPWVSHIGSTKGSFRRKREILKYSYENRVIRPTSSIFMSRCPAARSAPLCRAPVRRPSGRRIIELSKSPLRGLLGRPSGGATPQRQGMAVQSGIRNVFFISLANEGQGTPKPSISATILCRHWSNPDVLITEGNG